MRGLLYLVLSWFWLTWKWLKKVPGRILFQMRRKKLSPTEQSWLKMKEVDMIFVLHTKEPDLLAPIKMYVDKNRSGGDRVPTVHSVIFGKEPTVNQTRIECGVEPIEDGDINLGAKLK